MRPLPLLLGLLAAAACQGGEADARRLRLSQEGQLEAGDALNDSGCLEDLVTVALDKGPARIRLHSDAFDPRLRVVGPDDSVHENDDLDGHDSGIDLVVRMPGMYRIHVAACSENERGGYRLVVQGTRLVGEAAAAPASDLDRVQLASGQALAGRVAFARVAMTTPFGVLAPDPARIRGLERESGGLTTLEMIDGSRIQGWIDGEPAELRLAGGGVLPLPLRDLVRLVPATATAPAIAVPAADLLWIQLGGTRLAARWTAPDLVLRSVLGDLRLPCAAIAAVMPPDRERPVGEVRLRDGSRLSGMPASLPLATVEATGRIPLGASVQAVGAVASVAPFALTLVNGDVVVGTVAAFTLRSPYGTLPLPAGGVASLAADEDYPGLLALTLTGGELVFGAPLGDQLVLATAWQPALAVPGALITRGGPQRPAPAPSDDEPDEAMPGDEDLEAAVEAFPGAREAAD